MGNVGASLRRTSTGGRRTGGAVRRHWAATVAAVAAPAALFAWQTSPPPPPRDPAEVRMVNEVGMQRSGVPQTDIDEIKHVYLGGTDKLRPDLARE